MSAPPAEPAPDGMTGTSAGNGHGAGGSGGNSPFTPGQPPDNERAACVEAFEPMGGLGLHFVVDESLAMVFPRDLWTPLGAALDGFVAEERAAGLSIGLQLFQGECEAAAYAMPDVPIAKVAELPSLGEHMEGRSHGTGAATTLALAAGRDVARAWSEAHKTRAAVVLISSSEPTACASSAASAAESAQAGLALARPVPTYVIALRTRPSLDQIAHAGGTDGALIVTDTQLEPALLAGIESVAERATCEFALPAAAAPYLPDRVNLRHRTPAGQDTRIPRVDGLESCDPIDGGFYYDDPQNPARIVTCPATCARMQQGGEVDLEYGCPTATR